MKVRILFAALAMLMFAGCCEEPPGPLSLSEAEVEISFRNMVSTRAVTEQENTMHTVDLLVFDGNGVNEDDAVFSYARYAWPVSGSTYRTTLKQGAGLNIYFAINARGLASSLAEGMTYAQAKQQLLMTDPGSIDLVGDGLPMWGMALNRTITDASPNQLGTVKLLRSVASTDIAVIDANFTLAKGYIVFGADRGYLPYSSSNVSAPDAEGDFQPLLPEPPTGMATTAEWSAVPTATNAIANVFYMYDNDADGTGTGRRTKVILEGRWSGSPQADDTFYPLAFRDPDTGEKLKVKRNSKYLFVVTKVNGDGYGSLEEAKEAEELNMEYDVIEWNQNDDGDIYIDGPYYFSIASRKVLLASHAGAVSELVFVTNYAPGDILMKYSEGDAGVSGEIDTHPRFKVETIAADIGDAPRTCFRITTKQEYGVSDNPATLIVTAGRIKFTIEIEQGQVHWEFGGNQNVNVTAP